MERVTVTVPDGLVAGDEFVVSASGGEFEVTVPKGVSAGEAIDLELPATAGGGASSSSDDGLQRVIVAVPDGVYAGEPFIVNFDGQEFEIVVPDGVVAGEEIEVAVPAATSGPPAPPPTADQGGVSWNDWDSTWAPTPKGSTEWTEAAAPAPYYGRYKTGEKVQVQRSSGDWSPATIMEYDELSDTYTIELLVSKLYKYMLSENEIQPLEFKAQQAGEHFVGRRVQVPFVGAESKDDVMGEVRGYDQATGTYTVTMDNGSTKRGLPGIFIKVRPERKKKAT